MKKALIGGGIVVALVILVFATRVSGADDGKAVAAAEVKKQTIDSSVLASGTLAYREEVDLRPEVIGKVSAVPVEEGDQVRKGQVVVRIDPETFKAEVATRQANVRMAEIAIKQQQLTIKNLENDWQRKKKLFDQGLIDTASYDNATNQLAIARAELASRQQALSLNKAQLAKAREQLDRTIIRAPIDGIVTQVDVKPGETVISGTTNIIGSALMNIADPSAMFAEVRVDEADIAHIELDQNVDVTAVAYPNDSLDGRVTFIGTSATTAEGHQGLSFKVKVLLAEGAKLDLRPGMSCRAQIHTRTSKDTLAVPVQAVLYTEADRKKASIDSASGYVFVIEDGHATKRTVTTGISNDQNIAILSGLKAGDKVVTGPYQTLHHLKAGDALTISSTPANNAKG
ncbi:MAG TPA: efflux RND transporter periplasmic adaptor subunit [Gammaproteobacteria bacterium]|nr:efflux RND transporter periplasmic adaptor subunit [Gammaproteobacteria bacterium]